MTTTIETFPNMTINSYRSIGFIAGGYKEFYFHAYTSASAPIDVTYLTGYWTLSPYSNPSFIVLAKYGRSEGNFFTISLLFEDTLNLSGKFIQQTMLLGSELNNYRLGQGIIYIVPAITSASSISSSSYF
jgi:hypothetical protein